MKFNIPQKISPFSKKLAYLQQCFGEGSEDHSSNGGTTTRYSNCQGSSGIKVEADADYGRQMEESKGGAYSTTKNSMKKASKEMVLHAIRQKRSAATLLVCIHE